jgi:hypothetical protein
MIDTGPLGALEGCQNVLPDGETASVVVLKRRAENPF